MQPPKMVLISQTKKSTIGEGERKILTTIQHKLYHKFVSSTIILKYIQRKKQLDSFFIFLKDIQSKNNEYIDDVSTCKQPELLIFLKDIQSKKIGRFDHNFKRHPKKKRPKKREM